MSVVYILDTGGDTSSLRLAHMIVYIYDTYIYMIVYMIVYIYIYIYIYIYMRFIYVADYCGFTFILYVILYVIMCQVLGEVYSRYYNCTSSDPRILYDVEASNVSCKVHESDYKYDRRPLFFHLSLSI